MKNVAIIKRFCGSAPLHYMLLFGIQYMVTQSPPDKLATGYRQLLISRNAVNLVLLLLFLNEFLKNSFHPLAVLIPYYEKFTAACCRNLSFFGVRWF